MNTCPCCSHRLLRHIRSHEVYYFCRQCWQEVPVVTQRHNHKFQPMFVDKKTASYVKTI